MAQYQRVAQWVKRNRDLVFDLLRIYLGVGLLVRGALYLAEPAMFGELVEPEAASWLTSPTLLYFVAFVHIIGGSMMALGFLTRVAALIQVPILIGAVFLVHLRAGMFSANQSFEFSMLVLFLLVLVFLHGSGRWSIDHRLNHNLSPFKGLDATLDAYGHHAFELLRVYLGVGLFVRGLIFVADSSAFVELVGTQSTGLLTSYVLVHYVALAHLVGGTMMALGFLTRVAALIQVPILVGAVFLVHLQGGLFEANQSFEFSALVLFVLVLLFLYGSGHYSMDYYVFERPAPDDEAEAIKARMAARAAEPHRSFAPPQESILSPDAYIPSGAFNLTCPTLKDECPVVACGNWEAARHHEWIEARARYSPLGALYFLGGITAPPKEVVFHCRRCRRNIDATRDAEVLTEFKYP